MKRKAFFVWGVFADIGFLGALAGGLYLTWVFFDWFVWFLRGY